jgi:ribosomal protein L24
MKKANAIIRSKINVTERLISEAGLSQTNALAIQKPDFAGRIGFPAYKLTNNNANIKRLQDRVNMLSNKLDSAKKGNETYNFTELGGGGSIEINYDIDRVQLVFSNGRVDNELYKKLRSNGYVYSPTNKAFQRKITPQAISNAIYLTKATKDVSENVADIEEETEISLSEYSKMLESRNFTFATVSFYDALPKEFTGVKRLQFVYFSLNKYDVEVGIKKYLESNLVGVNIDKVSVSQYPKTYVKEAKILFSENRFLPTDMPPHLVLSPLYKQLQNFNAMQNDMREEEGVPDAVLIDRVINDLSRRYDNSQGEIASGLDFKFGDTVIGNIGHYKGRLGKVVFTSNDKSRIVVELEHGGETGDVGADEWSKYEKSESTEIKQDKVQSIASEYGWTAKPTNNGGYEFTNRNGKMVAIMKVEKGRNVFYDSEGKNKLGSDSNLERGVEHLIGKYFYGKKETPKVQTLETIEPNTNDEFDQAIMDNIEPHDDWVGNLIKERDVKQQIYKQIIGDEDEKKLETERIFYLYAKKHSPNKELHEMHQQKENMDKKIEDLSDLHELDMWKQFPDGRWYRKFNLPNDERFRGFTDNGIKHQVSDVLDGRVSVILSVKTKDEADRVSEEFMETYPINPNSNEINTMKDQLAKLESNGNLKINSKIPAKYITLQIGDDRRENTKYTDYDYNSANDRMRWLLDNKDFSDLNYNIEFEDGETLGGVIDCEPRDFFDNVNNPLTRHLNTFWGNVAKSNGKFVGLEAAQQAKDLIEKYDLGEGESGKFNVIKKKDGRTFYTLNNGDIEVVEKTDGTAYVTTKGQILNDLGNTGYTRDADIIDFDNIADAKKFALEQSNKPKLEIQNEESKPFGLTTIEYLDGGKTVTWGTKTNRGRETVIGKSNSDINEEIESLKEYIQIGEIELKKAQEQYDKVKGIGSPKMYKSVADALSNLKMIERTLYVNKNILLPFFEKNINEESEQPKFNNGQRVVLKADNNVGQTVDDNTKDWSAWELPSEKNIEKNPNDEIGDVTALTDAQLERYLDMLKIKDVGRAIPNASNVKISIENEIKKRSTSNSTSDFKGLHYDYKNQYVLNKAIEELLSTKDDNFTSEEKLFMRKYSGYGGLDKYGKTGKGGLFEFYTPSEIIERMWGLAYKYGYNNGSVLETSVGTGEFLKYAPKDARLVGYEISEYSAKICKILYPTAEIHLQPFEKLFIKNNYTMKNKIESLEKFSLVIGNPPYGDFSTVESRYMSGMGEKDYTGARNYVEYFIRRGVDLLESGGLLVFIVGSQLVAGGKMFLDSDMTPVKEWLAQNCTLETAYRLPDSVFERTGVTADIIVLKKN